MGTLGSLGFPGPSLPTLLLRRLAGEFAPLLAYDKLGRDAQLSIPTPEHYLPLLYVLGAQQQGEKVKFPIAGIDGGSISMLAVRVG